MIHLYCGDGKGKTTAAVGLAARCAGAGGRVLFFQFLKDNTSSERTALKMANIDVIDGIDNMKFVWNMSEAELAVVKAEYEKMFRDIKAAEERYDMLILDEIVHALNYGFLSEDDLLEFIKISRAEIVLTGREPSERLTAAADYVTEMKKIKHPYDNGMGARPGIEL